MFWKKRTLEDADECLDYDALRPRGLVPLLISVWLRMTDAIFRRNRVADAYDENKLDDDAFHYPGQRRGIFGLLLDSWFWVIAAIFSRRAYRADQRDDFDEDQGVADPLRPPGIVGCLLSTWFQATDAIYRRQWFQSAGREAYEEFEDQNQPPNPFRRSMLMGFLQFPLSIRSIVGDRIARFASLLIYNHFVSSVLRLVGGLRNGFAFIQSWVSIWILRSTDWLAQSRWFWWVAVFLQAIFTAYVTCTEFLWGWLLTRNYRQLTFGIPVYVLACPLIGFAILTPLRGPSATQYRTALRDAIAEQNTAEASLFYRKLKNLEAIDDRIVFQQALSLADNGDTVAAYDLLNAIASEDGIGFVPAHLWIAKSIMANKLTFPSEQANRLVETHLRLADEGQPGSMAVQRLMAQFYNDSRDADRAVSILEPLATNNIPARLDLAVSYLNLGLKVEGRKEALTVVQHFAEQRKDGVKLTPAAFLFSSRAWKILNRYDLAVVSLESGLSDYQDDTPLQNAFVRVLVEWLAKQPKKASRMLVNRIALIERAMKLAPSNPGILRQVAIFSARPDSVGKRCNELLQPMVEADDLLPPVRFVLATNALRRQDYDTARKHFRILYESDSEKLLGANNLAWLYSNTDPVQLDEALALANKAVLRHPDNPKCRNLRGQILVKMQQWLPAIEDLEIAVNALPNQSKIHESLATAYEHLENLDLAAAHRQTAESIRNRRPRL